MAGSALNFMRWDCREDTALQQTQQEHLFSWFTHPRSARKPITPTIQRLAKPSLIQDGSCVHPSKASFIEQMMCSNRGYGSSSFTTGDAC